MSDSLLTPDYIFEASWEVCNKVGGIYTVLSTRAHTLQQVMPDRLIFVGPDVWKDKANPLFAESDNLCAAWRQHATEVEHLPVRVGRWNIPGNPIAILVDFGAFYAQKNDWYGWMWEHYGVDSLHAYGDYDEACMFAIATGKVVESYYKFCLTPADKVVFQAHEWMTGMAALYLQQAVPQIATIFTTHATSIGRSIAANGKPLYDYFTGYNGDQMASELNMEAKHSVEKQAAHHADCFTTVSKITARECTQLLDKAPDVILPNGFEDNFVPAPRAFAGRRNSARGTILRVANALLGQTFETDPIIVSTSGRYEFKNKGIDVFVDAMNRLRYNPDLARPVLALVNVPAWVAGPREDLQERLRHNVVYDTPLEQPYLTHRLHNADEDRCLGMMRHLNVCNAPDDRVKLLFVPCYLNGDDGIFNKSYYDLLVGHDLTVYASYYEPWGYTPLESVAFRVPTVTTDLAGFGLWVNELGTVSGLPDGVEVVHRSDYNYHEVVEAVCRATVAFSHADAAQTAQAKKGAAAVAEQALWKHFIQYYYNAYDFALRKADERLKY